MRESRAPSDAAAAPNATTGTAHDHPPRRDSVSDRRSRSGDPGCPQTAEQHDGDHRVEHDDDTERDDDGARNRAFGRAHLLTHRRDARIPGEGEEEQTGRLEDAVPAGSRTRRLQRRRVQSGTRAGDHGERQHEQHDHHDHFRECRRAGHAAIVRCGERHDSDDGDRLLPARRRGIGGERQCHRGAARGLADDETPAGGETPPVAESFAAVDVGAARGRVLGGQLCGRRGVAERDDGGDEEADQQAGPGGLRGGGERGEDPGADHGAEPDEDGVDGSETAGERRVRGHSGTLLHPGGALGGCAVLVVMCRRGMPAPCARAMCAAVRYVRTLFEQAQTYRTVGDAGFNRVRAAARCGRRGHHRC